MNSQIFKNLLKYIKKKPKMQDKLLQLAQSKIGTDFTNDRIVSDDVSCAYALSTILHELIDFPIEISTTKLYKLIKDSSRFVRIYEPEAGCIIISPTGYAARPEIISNGHCGIYLDNEKIMSNDSATGLWSVNFTKKNWRKRYYYRGGYPVYLYRLIK
jgi:hypothetical protein